MLSSFYLTSADLIEHCLDKEAVNQADCEVPLPHFERSCFRFLQFILSEVEIIKSIGHSLDLYTQALKENLIQRMKLEREQNALKLTR